MKRLRDVWGYWEWDFAIDYYDIASLDDVEKGVEESKMGDGRTVLLMVGLHQLALARVHMIKEDSQTEKGSLEKALIYGMKAVEDLEKANQYPHYLYGLQVLAEIYLHKPTGERESGSRHIAVETSVGTEGHDPARN